jgi:hypothetical protein
MLESSRALAVLAEAADGWAVRLSDDDLRSPADGVAAGIVRHNPTRELMSAMRSVDSVRELARELHIDLDRAAEAYGLAERTAEAATDLGSSIAGYSIGAAAPFIAALLMGALPSLALAFGFASLMAGSPRGAIDAASRWGAANAGALRNPAVVAMVRQVVSGTDDAMLGAARVPFPLARVLGDRSSGAFGVHGAAGTIVALAGPRALTETPVSVDRVQSGRAAAPDGFTDLARRIPTNGPGAPQVRIERYDVGEGRPHWVVYAGGTVDASFTPTDEPWDDTSNLQGVAGLDPASARAANAALQAAGAQPGDAVLPVGYSQGGIVATDIATAGVYQSPELVTFGSPTGQVAIPHGTIDVAVEHRDDVIPALGGGPRSVEQGGLDRVLVQRTAFADTPPVDDTPLAAHHIGVYAQTAAQMDASSDPRLSGARDTLDDFTGGRDADVTMWRAERISSAGSGDAR